MIKKIEIKIVYISFYFIRILNYSVSTSFLTVFIQQFFEINNSKNEGRMGVFLQQKKKI